LVVTIVRLAAESNNEPFRTPEGRRGDTSLDHPRIAANSAPNEPAGHHEPPSDGLLPKTEIGALKFLEQHPTYDGRGVIIAVLDSGVDPGAPGLQKTSDGRPKIVDLIDASGSGDVDTSTVVEAVDGKFTGLSGRVLRPDPKWKNPTGKFHIGLKAATELFPAALVNWRLAGKKRELWDAQHRPLQARLQQAIVDWKAAHPAPSNAEEREGKDLEARLEQWRALDDAFEDPGPVFDCVVFHDGEVWRAVLDTNENGDLSDETVLANFRLEHRYATFSNEDLLNFTVNIFNEGNLLSIVTPSDTHGSHVSGIDAAYFPEQPDLNGIAPGAQIVGINQNPPQILNGNMEISSAIVRALAAVRELKCDVVNTSFGESTARPNEGRVIELLSEMVYEDGITLISAVHNLGPALSTVGAPGGTAEAAIGVANYWSPAMMRRQGGAIDPLAEVLTHSSSRGPAADGALGVSVCAPGSAFSSVPNYSLSRHQRKGGTSMATPTVSGAVALLISGLKSEGLTWTPWSLRRALENTARPVPGMDVCGQGCGLVQVGPAFELARRLGDTKTAQPRFKTMFFDASSEKRGIYLREPEETKRPVHGRVIVQAVFPKRVDNREKLAYEGRFRIESTTPWVRTGQSVFVVNGNNSGFDVVVDPTQPESGVHWAEIRGFEEGHEDRGPAFRLPVTVTRPVSMSAENPGRWSEEMSLKPGALQRRFIEVPSGVNWLELRIRAASYAVDRAVGYQLLQMSLGQRPQSSEGFVFLRGWQEDTARVQVMPGRTLEIVIGDAERDQREDQRLAVSVEFRGIIPATAEVFFDGAARVLPVQVSCASQTAALEPMAKLQARRRAIAPSQADISPLNPGRDCLPDGRRLHQLVLSYTFSVDERGPVIPKFPGLFRRLYDGEFEGQVWMLFDEAKRLISEQDNVWAARAVPVSKGQYTLKFHLRHEKLEWLEKMKSLPLMLEQPLGQELKLAWYRSPDGPFTGKEGISSGRPLMRGETAVLYLGAPSQEQLAKAGKPGELLMGSIRYEADPCPVSYPLTFLIPPADNVAKSSSAGPDTEKSEKKNATEQLASDRRDFEVAQLAKWSGPTNRALLNEQFEQLQPKYPDHLPLFAERLHCLDGEGREQHLRSVVAAADEVVRRIDTNRLAGYFGVRTSPEDATSRKAQEEMQQQRDALVDALHRKARALACMERPETPHAGNVPASECEPAFEKVEIDGLFEATFSGLRRWVDTTGDDYVTVHRHWEWRHGRLGEDLKLLRGQIEKKPTDRALREQQIRLLKELGWEHCATNEERWLLRRFPKSYPAF
jgi:tripeptidyl-peptidase-2